MPEFEKIIKLYFEGEENGGDIFSIFAQILGKKHLNSLFRNGIKVHYGYP